MATHIEDFATQLRALKERSGRSYGQLAARLHVSTSTLHRYCNGAAVPTDYAPVERLARLCGAAPDELVTLHRRWILADAARREPDRPAEAPAVGPVAETDPRTPEPSTTEPAVEPTVQPTVEPAAATATAQRPRRAALVLGAVAAVAVVAALPLALHGGGGSRNLGASSPAAGQIGTGAGAANPSASPFSSVSATGSPSATTSASTTASASPSGSGSAGAASSGAAWTPGAPTPFQVSVLADNWDTQCGQWFLMNQQPGKVPPPPSLEQTGAWARALGGIPAGHLRLQLTVQGLTDRSVVLHALYVHVVSSKPAPKGIGYTPGSGCGGGLTPASFAVNLDATVPRTRAVAGYVGNGDTSTLSDFPYQVSAPDPQVLDVDASTLGQDVSWYLELVWSSGGHQDTQRVDDHGRPFRTVGLKGLPGYFYDGTAWAPSSQPGA